MNDEHHEFGFALVDGDSAHVRDLVLLYQGGRCVGRVHGTLDLSDCPEPYHDVAIGQISRVRFYMPTEAHLEHSARVMSTYHRLLSEYEALPWYRRLWRVRPTVGAVADTLLDAKSQTREGS